MKVESFAFFHCYFRIAMPNSSKSVHNSNVTGRKRQRDLLREVNEITESPREEEYAWYTRLKSALSRPKIRELIDWEIPTIEDISAECQVDGTGSVRAIRMDKLRGASNLKKPVVGGLVLLQALRGLFTEETDYLADGGNMNMGFSLKYYCGLFGLRGRYVMSRLFDQEMVDIIDEEYFNVVQAPDNQDVGMEREFYAYLLSLMKKRSFRTNTTCLWHARYSKYVMNILGDDLADNVSSNVSKIVVGVGSGATLSALDRVRCLNCKEADIVVPEHRETPVIKNYVSVVEQADEMRDKNCNTEISNEFRSHSSKRVPHFVIGPHYEEINPYLIDDVSAVDEVWHYVDSQWMRMSKMVQGNSLPVGNSSAANLFVSKCLADSGHDVLTVIYEPMRDYYRQ